MRKALRVGDLVDALKDVPRDTLIMTGTAREATGGVVRIVVYDNIVAIESSLDADPGDDLQTLADFTRGEGVKVRDVRGELL